MNSLTTFFSPRLRVRYSPCFHSPCFHNSIRFSNNILDALSKTVRHGRHYNKVILDTLYPHFGQPLTTEAQRHKEILFFILDSPYAGGAIKVGRFRQNRLMSQFRRNWPT
jgi:hypothetical protein